MTSSTSPGLVAAYEQASGRSLAVQQHGSLGDLDARIAELQAADPSALYSYLPLMYWRSMLDGSSKLHDLVNDRYRSMRPMTVAEYVAREGL